jgi:putative spermidine/putrescine transport system ATP-binding protein
LVLDVDGLTKNYHRRRVLDSVGFSLSAGEFLSIIGPSGSGKSTLLKIIAGLETADAGGLRFEKNPDRRSPVILVFQDLQLFPHLSVYENVAFGLRARKSEGTEIEKKVDGVLLRLGISGRAGAYPASLSGGEQQRTALARALVLDPQLLLLDEPFSNLDPNLKGDAALFIRETTRTWNTPVICVTHDFEEAFSMSDRIGVLLDGRLVQIGPPRDVFLDPVSLEAARFMGPVNHLPADFAREFTPRRGDRDLYLRPEALEFVPAPGGDASLVMSCFLGHRVLHVVDWRGKRWEAAGTSLNLAPGTRGKLIFHIEED